MKISKVLYRLLLLGLSAVFLFSGCMVGQYILDSLRQKNEYDDLAAQVEQARPEILQTAPSAPIVPDLPTEPVVLPEYASLFEENSDFVGWITIDGTPINYPVTQSPDRPDYYLKRNFHGDYSEHGCLYVRESCDVFAPSDNVTIYGHHMKDGSMFTGLDKFRKQSFWENHHTINFDTIYERHTYTVFAVFVTTATAEEGFSYHLFEDAADEAEFDHFVSACKALADYDTGITPQYGDKLICLSTCEYSQFNGRLVVAAVRDEINENQAV